MIVIEIKNLRDLRLQRIMDREKDRLRQLDQYYEYSLVKDWDVQFDFTHCELVQIGDIFGNLVQLDDRMVLALTQFSRHKFMVDSMLDWLENYSLYWQEEINPKGFINGAAAIVEGVHQQLLLWCNEGLPLKLIL
ncbi:MAG: hypothetical protein ABRQ24_03915 [Syntrophomonadaceae bacterium]